MNRVILCGRLANRPRLTYAPCGLAVAHFRVFVTRRNAQPGDETAEDGIDCIAVRRVAIELYTWGEAGVRVNLEGQLTPDSPYPAGRQPGLRVLVDHAYCADPEPADVARWLLVRARTAGPRLRQEQAA